MSDFAANTKHPRGPRASEAPIPRKPELTVVGASSSDRVVADPLAARESEALVSGAHPKIDSDQEILRVLAEHQGSLTDWGVDGLDLAREHRQAMQWVEWLLKDGMVPTEWHETRIELPRTIHITFEPRNRRQLGTYTLGRTIGQGLKYTVNLNPRAIVGHPPAVMASVLLHEFLHLCQDLYCQRVGKRLAPSSYHGVEFRRRADLLGISCTQAGRRLPNTPNGPFDKWLRRRGISSERVYEIETQPGSSRLPKRIAWRCRCEDSVAVHVPRGSTIEATCVRCDGPFQPTSLDESKLVGRSKSRVVRKR